MWLRLKLTLSAIAIVLVIAGIGAAIDYRREFRERVSTVLLSLQEEGGALRAARERIPDDEQYIAYVHDFCTQTNAIVSPGHHIYILDSQGRILARSHRHEHEELEKALLATDVEQAIIPLAGRRLAQARVHATDGTAIVVVEYLDRDEANLRHQLLSRAATTATITLAVVGLITLTLSRWILGPLGKLAEAARALGAGNLSSRAALGGSRDLRTVQEEFNRMAERIEANDRELRRSNKDLEAFGYIVSHDLKEPLRAVASFLGLLEKRCQNKLDAKSKEYVGYVLDGARRMEAIISDLLLYSRTGVPAKPPKLVDSGKSILRSIENLKVPIEESGAVVTFDGQPEVLAEERDLTQVFQNLIGNAIKFRGQTPPRVHVSARKEDRFWIFAVRDNGIGIPPEHTDLIFQVFQRLHTRDEYPGSGIGLAICKKVIERGGGRIWVESAPEKGTTFFFSISAGDERQAQ